MFNVVCGLCESFILFVPLHIIRINVMCACVCVRRCHCVCVYVWFWRWSMITRKFSVITYTSPINVIQLKCCQHSLLAFDKSFWLSSLFFVWMPSCCHHKWNKMRTSINKLSIGSITRSHTEQTEKKQTNRGSGKREEDERERERASRANRIKSALHFE